MRPIVSIFSVSMADSPQAEKPVIKVPGAIVIKDLAELLKLPVTRVMAELIKNGVMSSMNERIDFDTAAVIAEDLGFTLQLEEANESDRQKTSNEQLEELFAKDDSTNAIERPPIVVVMGHVDHGKTKLLDRIRETNVIAGESGGITQHIGAYQVEKKGKRITFIDTPGHEAFSAMRSRGAHVADIAILVVAADDGIKPQTKEAIQIIRHAGLPFVIAINKVDKAEANIERVKQQLAEENLLPEDWGGKVVTVPVSAATGAGIDDLLDTVLLVADLEKEHLMADPKRGAVGSVIEAHIDTGEGPVATVIVLTGTLNTGDLVRIGDLPAKVKSLRDWRGNIVRAAGPSTPVRLLGLKRAPEVGEILHEVDADTAKQLRRTQKQQPQHASSQVVYQTKKSAENNEGENTVEKQFVNIVLRSDNLGSQEAILSSLQIYENAPVGVDVVTKGLGSITEADVLRADTASAMLLGFHVVATPQAAEVAKGKHIPVRTYKVIYDLLNDVKKEVEARLPVEIIEHPLGHLRVLAVFKQEKNGMIVGGRVIDGVAKNNAKARVTREGQLVAEGSLRELQLDKKKVDEVKSGRECGIRFDGPPLIQVDDVIEFYEVEERKIALTS